MKKENIPNYISLIRILLVPLYAIFFFGTGIFDDPDRRFFAAGIVFICAGLSDALDGYLARRFNWISDIGKLLDPFADKMMELCATLCLAIEFKGPFVFLAVIIVLKEVIMIVGAGLIMAKSKIYLSSVWYGKVTTLVWYVLICLVTFFPSVRANVAFCHALCIFLILIMILAFILYLCNYHPQIKSTKDVILKDTKNSIRKK